MPVQQKQRIDGQEATLFRNGKYPVYVLQDGRFAVMWERSWRIRGTLKALDNFIAQPRKSIRLMRYHHSTSIIHSEVQTVDAIEVTFDKIVDLGGKSHRHGWGDWFVYDADLAAQFADFEKRRRESEKALNAEYAKLCKKAKRVSYSNFAERMKQYGTGGE